MERRQPLNKQQKAAMERYSASRVVKKAHKSKKPSRETEDKPTTSWFSACESDSEAEDCGGCGQCKECKKGSQKVSFVQC
jgi:hypothetical protein